MKLKCEVWAPALILMMTGFILLVLFVPSMMGGCEVGALPLKLLAGGGVLILLAVLVLLVSARRDGSTHGLPRQWLSRLRVAPPRIRLDAGALKGWKIRQPASEDGNGGAGTKNAPSETGSVAVPPPAEPINTELRHQQAWGIVRKHMAVGMTLSLAPIPILDVAALTGAQLNMLDNLSAHYGVDFNKERGKSLVVAMLCGSLPTTALMALSSISKAIPGIGSIGGNLGLSAVAGGVIFAVGKVFIRHFEAGGSLENFDGKQAQAEFQQALREGKQLAVAKKPTGRPN
ncbi:DUF697 domain-containing protein [Candidatus Thiothrix sp. Deng01]|uniref:DUF697 domain-containing protein n=1 Tax=Candidatus Thiothrix phosphatis TaxID=3112415 RepID=A0ABU6CXX6_9GAMM|nr:DUF697 domain-containing protein [Candidatus Thiothrix sp. Deng01]MEB4591263.1 DUF697 domain-containing protein [Candidatus Thiothrix sp. Deng01]